MFFILFTLLSSAIVPCLSEKFEDPTNPGYDLAYYVTRPDIRAPILNVTHYEPEELMPGYWFMAPYASLIPTSLGKEYSPFQAGPHIYDNTGELIWSGAKLVENRNTYDFRVSSFEGEPALTFILDGARGASDTPKGAGMILDGSYEVRDRVTLTREGEGIDMHEFNVINGKTSLSVFNSRLKFDISNLNLNITKSPTVLISQSGIREIDLENGKILFEWWPVDHISLLEVMVDRPKDFGESLAYWDCFHTNSVDKNQDGDYLVSMRYTSTIYKISGRDGQILWRLGGLNSDFKQDFNFSSQHDAKFYSSNSSMTVISFLDNASDEHTRQPTTSTTSSVKIVAIDEKTKIATILKQYNRPDGGLTRLRGQAQTLENGNIFAGWSEHGMISEFTEDGRSILEASYIGHRFNSYRAYKFNFVGTPREPPVLRTHGYGSGSLGSMSSVFAVSWNGATEVAAWAFYGTNDRAKPFEHLGSMNRSGFETTYIDPNFWAFSYAEARLANGSAIRQSDIMEIILPNGHNRNITAAGLAVQKKTQERKSAFMVSGVVLVGLFFSGALSLALIVWTKGWPNCCCRPMYAPVRNEEREIEAGEMRSLKEYEDESGSESESEAERGGKRKSGSGRGDGREKPLPKIIFDGEADSETEVDEKRIG